MTQRRNPADRTTAEVAHELGVSNQYVPGLAREAQMDGEPHKYMAGRRCYYTPAAVAAMREWLQEHGASSQRVIRVDVDTATLRHWYLEARYTTEYIGRQLGIGENTLYALLARRGIPSRRAGPQRCECGVMLDEHPRCARCGQLLCAAFPEHGPGPVCHACRRDFVLGLRDLLATRVPAV